MTAPVVRLHLFFATENDTAIILRQGPSKVFRLILWDRATETFEDGQWLMHKVYPERCALSPDGRHFIYFALNGDWRGDSEGAYTAISRPPYFTALALFPEGNTWGGGGVFVDDRHYWASGGDDVIGRASGLSRVVIGDRGKGCTTGIRLTSGQRAPLDRAATRRLLADPAPKDARGVFDRLAPPPPSHAIDRYDTQGGVLYRRHGLDLDPIRDFTDMTFEPIRAPYDWRDEAETDPTRWHPLDGER